MELLYVLSLILIITSLVIFLFLRMKNKKRGNVLSEKQTDKLFVSTGKSQNLKGTLQQISKKLRILNPDFKNFRQIRINNV